MKAHRLLVAGIVFIFYRTLSWTWRVQLVEPSEMKTRLESNQAFILAHWHGDELVLVQLSKRYRIATITSTSKDGELMTRVLTWMGGVASRGSSTRGGVQALKGLIGFAKAGRNCSFAVDGPKGPLHKVKPGVFEVARLTKAPLFIAGIAVDRAWIFHKAWNKAVLPKPFAKVVIYWEQWPRLIDKSDDLKSVELAESLEKSLHEGRTKALKIIAEV